LAEGKVKWFSEKRVMVLLNRRTVRIYLSTTPQSTQTALKHSMREIR